MSQKPLNIIYMNSHDTGRWLGCYGQDVKTPALDRLATQGVRMTQMFSLAPTCSPSRAGLLTGQYPHQAGLLGNTGRGFGLTHPERHLATHLKSNGYHTAHVGVFSLRPTDQMGYDLIDEDVTQVDTAACDLLQQFAQSDEPFFLDLGFHETHRVADRYRTDFFAQDDVQLEPNDVGQMPACLADLPEVQSDWADFSRSVHSLDKRIGRVLEALEQTGLADDTLVIYTVDHGPPFPGFKGTLTDMGIGVAMIMRAPQRMGWTAGQTCDAMLSQLDLYPTICELAQIPKPDWLEGQSFASCHSSGVSDSPREMIFAEQTYHAAYEPLRAVRTEQYKYIQAFHDYPCRIAANADDGPSKDALLKKDWHKQTQTQCRLYDVKADPDEQNNLIDQPAYQSIAKQLKQKLEHWQHQTNDPILDGPVALPAGIRPVEQTALSPWSGR